MAKEKEKWYEDFAEGIVSSGLGTYYGIHDLFKELSPEQKANLKDWKDDAAESGYGTAGSVIGEIAQMALPGGAAVKGAKALQKAKQMHKLAKLTKAGKMTPELKDIAKLGWKGGLAADVASSAAFGAAQYQEDGGSRLEAAAGEGAGALAGGLVGKTLGRLGETAVKGIRKTDAAKEYAAMGGNMTPGKATSNPLIRMGEDALSFIGGPVRNLRDEYESQWQDMYHRGGALQPDMLKNKGMASETSFEEIKQQLDKTYQKGYKGKSNMAPDVIGEMSDYMSRLAKEKGSDKDGTVLKSLSESILQHGNKVIKDGNTITSFEGGNAELMDHAFRKAISGLRESGAHGSIIEEVKMLKKVFRNTLPEMDAKYLDIADEMSPNVKAITKARAWANPTPAAKGRVSGVNPDQALQAGGQVVSEFDAATNNVPLQKIAKLGQQTVGQKPFMQPMRFLDRKTAVVPSLVPERQVGNISKALTGDLDYQKSMQKVAESVDGQAVGQVVDVARTAGARGSMAPHAAYSSHEKEKEREAAYRKRLKEQGWSSERPQ